MALVSAATAIHNASPRHELNEGVVHDDPDNPEPELAERTFLARLAECVAGTASMYSLPIDSQLNELTDYLQNSIMDKTDIDVEHVKELLEL